MSKSKILITLAVVVALLLGYMFLANQSNSDLQGSLFRNPPAKNSDRYANPTQVYLKSDGAILTHSATLSPVAKTISIPARRVEDSVLTKLLAKYQDLSSEADLILLNAQQLKDLHRLDAAYQFYNYSLSKSEMQSYSRMIREFMEASN